MLKVAESALANHSGLEKVTIMNHGPRYDTQKVDPVGNKQQLASYANRFLLELWLDSPHKNRIFIGSQTLECSPNIQKDRYTDESSGRYDGVHLYGPNGKSAYTASVINILQSSVQTPAPNSSSQGLPNDSHNRCPQAKYKQKQNKMYSHVVTGTPPVKTQNRFSSLSENC